MSESESLAVLGGPGQGESYAQSEWWVPECRISLLTPPSNNNLLPMLHLILTKGGKLGLAAFVILALLVLFYNNLLSLVGPTTSAPLISQKPEDSPERVSEVAETIDRFAVKNYVKGPPTSSLFGK